MIASASPYDVSNPSILTKEKHKAAARLRVNTASKGISTDTSSVRTGATGLNNRRKQRQRPPVEYEASLPLPICRGCGAVLEHESNRKRSRAAYCPECLRKRRVEIGAGLPSASAHHRERFNRETGTRPTHTSQASSRRRESNIAQRSQELAWEAEHSGEDDDPIWFNREVVPRLRTLTLIQIAKATGMSTSSASKIRSGKRVPHARHWEALAGIAPKA
jgi:hypothetical protein